MTLSVPEFYNEKTVLVTGGTGFLGVCLIEKLLRCCPGLKNIYVLVRPKRGKEPEQRLQELTKNSVFNRLREENKTELFKKLIAVAGDVGEENLGLSSADRLTLAEVVQVVFHSAATLDFEADLKETTNVNILGTRRVVELCQEFRDLKALVHVSSAYVNSWQTGEVEEKVYPAPANTEEVLKLVKTLDPDKLTERTPEILAAHPNSYTFTKHLAEHEVLNGRIPAAIVRPSIITAAWKEPVPGWTISKNGPTGFVMGASKGVVRRLPLDEDIICDYIPVDLVVNSLLAAAYAVDRDRLQAETRGSKPGEVPVYHCTSSTSNPFRWRLVTPIMNHYLHQYPLKGAVWYPTLKFVPSIFMYKLAAIFVHFVPGYILDGVTKLSGGRPILVRMHTNINRSLRRLERFIFTEWMFKNERTLKLHESLSNDDKQTFNLDVRPLAWREYFVDVVKGVRTYLHKESMNTLAKARSKQHILLVVHQLTQVALLGLVWWMTKILFATTWTNTGMIVPITYFLFGQL